MSAEAINISCEKIDFGDAILFSDKSHNGNFSSVEIPLIRSKNEYSQYVIQQLIKHIHTDFVLIVQWDGYVTNPSAWTDEFLEYDYIGARWPWHKDGFTVGNGGFSLRSTKLMKEVLELQAGVNYLVNEDELICKVHRPQLEKHGIKFASDVIADKFSYERNIPQSETFGFHGLFNMWRHCDDSELIKRLDGLNPSTYLSVEYLELMLQYFQQQKFKIYKKMYQILLNNLDHHDLKSHLSKFIHDPNSLNIILEAN
jgi:hypothetical protein